MLWQAGPRQGVRQGQRAQGSEAPSCLPRGVGHCAAQPEPWEDPLLLSPEGQASRAGGRDQALSFVVGAESLEEQGRASCPSSGPEPPVLSCPICPLSPGLSRIRSLPSAPPHHVPLSLQLALRGPAGPMGLTGRPGPMVSGWRGGAGAAGRSASAQENGGRLCSMVTLHPVPCS